MRYITATIGALLIFVGCVVGGVVLVAFPAFQGEVTMALGQTTLTLRNPVALAGFPIGLLAAIHSFRSTLRRAVRSDEDKPVDP